MSLRARLLLGTVVIALVLVVTAGVIARSTERSLVNQVDNELEAIDLEGRFGGRRDGPPGSSGSPGSPGRPPPTGERFSELYLGLVQGDSVVTILEPDLTGDSPPRPDLSGEQITAAVGGSPFTVGTRSDLRWRVRAVEAGRGRLIALALPLDGVDRAVGRLVFVEVVAVLVVLAVLGLVTWWVLRLGVRPVKRMTAAAAAIAEGDLSQRVPEARSRTEAGELGAALNQMLGRIQEAFDQRVRSEERLRRFVADASHELRTPVTTIRGYAELYRTGGLDDDAELDEAMRRTEQEAERMGRLVDDLLHLARLDQGRPLEVAPVALDSIAEDAVRDARAVDPDRRITAATTAVTVEGDGARLRQVVANLVGNALAHTPAGTPVEVRVGAEGDRAVLEVADTGPGMAPEVAGRAFERFYRADPSRSGGGSGLGLAIVEATIGALGGTVSLRSAPTTGTTVRVELPARSREAPSQL